MINAQEKLTATMTLMPMNLVRSAFIARSRIESRRVSDTKRWMLDNGFEMLGIPDSQLLADDGREVIRVYGHAWALKPEIHAKRLAEAMDQARQHDAALTAKKEQKEQAANSTSQQTSCPALIDGQLCGGTLVRASVCPRCALGKSGVAATLTCDVCGHVTAIMRGGCNG